MPALKFFLVSLLKLLKCLPHVCRDLNTKASELSDSEMKLQMMTVMTKKGGLRLCTKAEYFTCLEEAFQALQKAFPASVSPLPAKGSENGRPSIAALPLLFLLTHIYTGQAWENENGRSLGKQDPPASMVFPLDGWKKMLILPVPICPTLDKHLDRTVLGGCLHPNLSQLNQ